MNARTSRSHPLQIATIGVPGGTGAIGVTLCPGKKDLSALTGAWDRDLQADIETISIWGASAVVCLMESHELELLKVSSLPVAVRGAGLAWFHLPIPDVSTPAASFERAWAETGLMLRTLLGDGKRVLLHCRGGLGRSGMIAARLLVELGMQPDHAIALVRKHRPGAIETPQQEAYVNRQMPMASVVARK
jgi:ADP-ribosyl-[dinitrogen reductase] hydrolase